MRSFVRHTAVKAIAWLLLALFLTLGLGSALGVIFLTSYGVYHDGGAYFRQEVLNAYCSVSASKVYYNYYPAVQYDYSSRIYWESYFAPHNCNFAFTLTDSDGSVLLQNATVAQSQHSYAATYDIPTNAQYIVREFYDTTEEADARLTELYDKYYVESSGINPRDLRYAVTCAMETRPVIDAPATDTPPLEESAAAKPRIEPLDVIRRDEEYSTYYFGTPENRDLWVAQQEKTHFVYGINYFEEATRYELVAYCFHVDSVSLTAQIPLHLTAKDTLYYLLALVQLLVDWQDAMVFLLIASVIMILALLVLLFCGAGRRVRDDEVHLSWFDRIPAEVLLFLAVTAWCTVFLIATEINEFWAVILALLLTIPVALLSMLILVSFAARLKARCFWRHTLTGWILYWLWCGCAFLWRKTKYIANSLPMIWQLALAWLLLCFFESIFVINNGSAVVWVLEKILLTLVLLPMGAHLAQLHKAAQAIASGEMQTKVDLRYMAGSIRRHGEYLNNITDGLQSAVDERMRSERLKTELITNVSHDIKTPLTSIVNYVDLLSQEDISSDTAKEYLAVLQRQSARLRKLTEDLVEASKAATGNIDAQPERMDVNVLLSQTAGEYEEKLSMMNLEPVLTLDDNPVEINADGRLLWRVFDNLMSNICKYALPGTRVYLTAHQTEDAVEIVFRNISRYPLNISSEELMERFVRGDASRSTEGSGLGLSIARSLTELQGGRFTLTVDGDLFKATIVFPEA